MSKNLIFLSDGTGNAGDARGATNVYRLYQRLHNDIPGHHRLRPEAVEAHLASGKVRQVTAYDTGIGSRRQEWIGRATGRGISRNIKEGYDFLLRFYEPGDRIYLFGFSRGAYTVRSLAGLIGLCGVPGRPGDRALLFDDDRRGGLVEDAYRIYRTEPGAQGLARREGLAARFIEMHGPRVHRDPGQRAVYMIGVWDTVRSLGLPAGKRDLELPWFRHRFHDHELSPHVRHAFHALAIDDARILFHPTIWNEPTAFQRAAPGAYAAQTFAQTWFAGVHGDVGGGHRDGPGLADVTLGWMIDRILAAKHPAILYAPYDADPKLGLGDGRAAAIGDPRDSFWKKLLYAERARAVVRGTQRPGQREIAPDPDDWHARLHRHVIDRLGDRDLSPPYDPPGLADHPDARLVREHRGRPGGAAPATFRFVDGHAAPAPVQPVPGLEDSGPEDSGRGHPPARGRHMQPPRPAGSAR